MSISESVRFYHEEKKGCGLFLLFFLHEENRVWVLS